MRLDKFICKSTQLTRNDAMQSIHDGAVHVNDEVVFNEAKQVHENNEVKLSGEKLVPRESRYILIHKPADTICSNIDEVYPSVFNHVDIENVSELHIAGRLDADTTGLVLATDDGRWSFNITRPEMQCEKVYRVRLSRPIAENVALQFSQGIQLQGEAKPTLPAKLEFINTHEVLLTIIEGRFHQVKRMFAAVGNRVVS
ncbi:MAG: Ribosomal small subunit pseudouridine synthase A (EC, partial [uncultured Thiotrichaceae bacterium]